MTPLVEPSWVASLPGDPLLVLFDATLPPVGVTPKVDTQARYLAAHLPGALFFDIEALSDDATSLPHMLPSPERFGRAMSRLGVSEAATIVVYEQGDVFSAPRAWWMLRTFGARNVYVLHGGLRAWMEAGLPIEAGAVHRAPAIFQAQLQENQVSGFAEIQRMLAQPPAAECNAQIVDARSAGRFEGAAPEPRAGLSSGHMPGAVNVPYTELIEGARFKPAEELCRSFEARHVDLHRPITTTCGSGVTAAVVLLGLEICGAQKVRLYDGSWAEYAQQAGAVIEKAG